MAESCTASVNLFGLTQYDHRCSYFGGTQPPLPQGLGWFIVVGLGFAFSVLTSLIVWLDSKVLVRFSSEHFSTAGRSIQAGLTACDIVSKWTWAATLLQSANVTWKYGIAGSFWYAAGATIQVLLFSVLAVEIKRKAPTVHTVLELVRTRWGGPAHLVFLGFCLMTNIVVTAMLILGGAAVIQALSGVNVFAAAFLIPVGVMIYTAQGGLKATFLASWSHVAIVYIALCIFMFKVYGTFPGLGSPSAVYDNLRLLEVKHPVSGNLDGSYLTMFSRGGFIFGLINIVGNFGTVFVDQAYYQSAIASKPSATYPGYVLGGLCWFAIPFSLATTLGLAARALDLPLSLTEANAGLVPPAVAVHLLGRGGAFLLVLQLFMAVTASGAAEQMAVASLVAYDVWRPYVNPSASGLEVIGISRLVVVLYGALSGILAIILLKLGLSLGWVYLFMGILIGSAVFPLTACITWKKCSAVAAITAALVGCPLAILTWLVTAAMLNDGHLNLDTTGQDFPLLAGNLVALFSSTILCVVLSYIWPQDYDWRELRSIPMVEWDPNAELATIGGPAEHQGMGPGPGGHTVTGWRGGRTGFIYTDNGIDGLDELGAKSLWKDSSSSDARSELHNEQELHGDGSRRGGVAGAVRLHDGGRRADGCGSRPSSSGGSSSSSSRREEAVLGTNDGGGGSFDDVGGVLGMDCTLDVEQLDPGVATASNAAERQITAGDASVGDKKPGFFHNWVRVSNAGGLFPWNPSCTNTSSGGMQSAAEGRAALDAAHVWTYRTCGLISGLLVVVWPLLALPARVFTKGYFTFWICIAIVWGVLATGICIIVPVYEARHSVRLIMAWTWMNTRRGAVATASATAATAATAAAACANGRDAYAGDEPSRRAGTGGYYVPTVPALSVGTGVQGNSAADDSTASFAAAAAGVVADASFRFKGQGSWSLHGSGVLAGSGHGRRSGSPPLAGAGRAKQLHGAGACLGDVSACAGTTAHGGGSVLSTSSHQQQHVQFEIEEQEAEPEVEEAAEGPLRWLGIGPDGSHLVSGVLVMDVLGMGLGAPLGWVGGGGGAERGGQLGPGQPGKPCHSGGDMRRGGGGGIDVEAAAFGGGKAQAAHGGVGGIGLIGRLACSIGALGAAGPRSRGRRVCNSAGGGRDDSARRRPQVAGGGGGGRVQDASLSGRFSCSAHAGGEQAVHGSVGRPSLPTAASAAPAVVDACSPQVHILMDAMATTADLGARSFTLACDGTGGRPEVQMTQPVATSTLSATSMPSLPHHSRLSHGIARGGVEALPQPDTAQQHIGPTVHVQAPLHANPQPALLEPASLGGAGTMADNLQGLGGWEQPPDVFNGSGQRQLPRSSGAGNSRSVATLHQTLADGSSSWPCPREEAHQVGSSCDVSSHPSEGLASAHGGVVRHSDVDAHRLVQQMNMNNSSHSSDAGDSDVDSEDDSEAGQGCAREDSLRQQVSLPMPPAETSGTPTSTHRAWLPLLPAV